MTIGALHYFVDLTDLAGAEINESRKQRQHREITYINIITKE